MYSVDAVCKGQVLFDFYRILTMNTSGSNILEIILGQVEQFPVIGLAGLLWERQICFAKVSSIISKTLPGRPGKREVV